MSTTDTNVPQVIVNKLTSAEYATATKSPTEFYAVTDVEVPIVGSTLSTPSNVAYVATANIQDGAVTTAKFADGAVTPAKMATATYQLDTEQVVGTWVNGKPLYRKVIDFGTLPNNTTKTVQIDGGSRVEVVDIHLSVHTDPDGAFATYAPVLPYYSSASSIISANFSEYVVRVTSNGDTSSFSAYVYVYYWKRTD